MCFHPCGVHYLALQVTQKKKKISGDIGGLVDLIYREFLNVRCMNLAVVVVPLQLLISVWNSNHFKMKVPAQSNTRLVLNPAWAYAKTSQPTEQDKIQLYSDAMYDVKTSLNILCSWLLRRIDLV